MERKVFDQYLFHGLGFPILLKNVPMVKFENDWAPDIDYEMLENCVLLNLCQKPSPLTGDEIKFVRSWFGMTLQAFGEKFGVSAACVKKWEDAKDHYSSMSEATEKLMRIFVLDHLIPAKGKESVLYRQKIKNLIDNHFIKQNKEPILIDAIQERIAI